MIIADEKLRLILGNHRINRPQGAFTTCKEDQRRVHQRLINPPKVDETNPAAFFSYGDCMGLSHCHRDPYRTTGCAGFLPSTVVKFF